MLSSALGHRAPYRDLTGFVAWLVYKASEPVQDLSAGKHAFKMCLTLVPLLSVATAHTSDTMCSRMLRRGEA